MQLTCSCAGLLPALAEEVGGEETVEGSAKAAQAGDDSSEGRWLAVGQSAMITTGALGAASSTCTHHP